MLCVCPYLRAIYVGRFACMHIIRTIAFRPNYSGFPTVGSMSPRKTLEVTQLFRLQRVQRVFDLSCTRRPNSRREAFPKGDGLAEQFSSSEEDRIIIPMEIHFRDVLTCSVNLSSSVPPA